MEDDAQRFGLFRSAFDDFLERTKAVADFVGSTGGNALGAVGGPVPNAVTGMLSSLRSLVEQAPPPTVPLDLFLQEVRAKKAMVTALREQLEAFSAQLDILERSLEPLAEWGHQWSRLQGSMLETLRVTRPRGDGTTGGA